MLHFEFNSREYTMPEGLHEITLRQMIAFSEVEKTIPESLKRIQEAAESEKDKLLEETDPLEINREWPLYYARVIGYWMQMEQSELEKMNIADIYATYIRLNKALTDTKPADMEHFNWKDENGEDCTYYLPQKFMHGSTLGEFIEAAQYEHHMSNLKKGNWDALPYIIAIICRKENEPFTEGLDERRAPVFMDLPAHIAVQVAFFLAIRNLSFLANSVTYVAGGMLTNSQRRSLKAMGGTPSLNQSGTVEHSESTDQDLQTSNAPKRQTYGPHSLG